MISLNTPLTSYTDCSSTQQTKICGGHWHLKCVGQTVQDAAFRQMLLGKQERSIPEGYKSIEFKREGKLVFVVLFHENNNPLCHYHTFTSSPISKKSSGQSSFKVLSIDSDN